MNTCNWFFLLQAWFSLVSGRVYNIGIGISHTFRKESEKVQWSHRISFLGFSIKSKRLGHKFRWLKHIFELDQSLSIGFLTVNWLSPRELAFVKVINKMPNSVAHEVPMVSFGFLQVQARKQRRREDSLLPTSPIVLSSLVIHLSRSSAIVLQGAGGFEAYLLPLPWS